MISSSIFSLKRATSVTDLVGRFIYTKGTLMNYKWERHHPKISEKCLQEIPKMSDLHVWLLESLRSMLKID